MSVKKISFEDGDRMKNKYTSDKNVSRRKKAKKKNKVGKIIAITILALIISVIIFLICLVNGRLNKLHIVEIDKSDLDVNENLLDQLNGSMSEKEFKDVVTIALFGSDSRDVSDMSSGRADSIIVASLNPKNKSISLLSIPRDTYVNVPGYGWTKINHAYAYGGEQLLIKTINSNFGLAITEYATIDFLGLANVINAMGGIELEISYDEMVVINSYLKEIYMLEGRPYTPMNDYGEVTLNGEQAVAHCRDRYVGSDFDRATRQRNVITAVIDKVASMSIDEAMNILDVGLSQITTNVDAKAYLNKVTNVLTNISDYKNNVVSAQVPKEGYDKYVDGIYYFGCDLDQAKKDFISYIYGN